LLPYGRSDEELAGRLGLEHDELIRFERIRELAADGTVVSYERGFLPPVPGVRELPERGLGQESLTHVMLRAGLRPEHVVSLLDPDHFQLALVFS
jgi:GntR family transcriptional regulator